MSSEGTYARAFQHGAFPASLWLWHEPAVGSVVLDIFGVAWQRVPHLGVQGTDPASKWVAAEYSLGCEEWGGLQYHHGPVRLLHDTTEVNESEG